MQVHDLDVEAFGRAGFAPHRTSNHQRALSNEVASRRHWAVAWPMRSLFKYFDRSPEVIRLAVMLYVRYPLSLRNVENLLAERGIDICHETGTAMVEPLRPTVRRGDQEQPSPVAPRLPGVAMAS